MCRINTDIIFENSDFFQTFPLGAIFARNNGLSGLCPTSRQYRTFRDPLFVRERISGFGPGSIVCGAVDISLENSWLYLYQYRILTFCKHWILKWQKKSLNATSRTATLARLAMLTMARRR
jgi:hypothetical protein